MTEDRPRYEPVEHTADVGIVAYGRTLPELFENAAFGLFDTIADLEGVTSGQRRSLELDAADLDDLLVHWLSELNFFFQTERVLFREFSVARISGPGAGREPGAAGPDESRGGGLHLSAEAGGQAFDPKRHEIRADVKGVTYHDLDIRKDEGGWEARVIFDV